MRKLLKFCLTTIFGLITVNYAWQNLVFSNQAITIIKVSFILAIFEFFLKPVIHLLLLPINFITLGSLRIVINTLGIYLAVFLLNDFQVKNINFSSVSLGGFTIPNLKFENFTAYLITSLTLSLILVLFKLILSKNPK
ncbi:MAG: phage holin family protein [Candidatus Shapirobacteria bacterium]